MKEYKGIIEAILFGSGEPVSISKISEVLELDVSNIKVILSDMQQEYNNENRGIELVFLKESCQLCSKNEYKEYIKKIINSKKNTPLSGAAMEVLAIVAYNQPISKSFIEQVRGVESSQIVNNLVEKDLLEEAGRLEIPGKPIAYKTTLNFLRCFGISAIENLPPLPDQEGQVMLNEVIKNRSD